jgi:hypothetical protein
MEERNNYVFVVLPIYILAYVLFLQESTNESYLGNVRIVDLAITDASLYPWIYPLQ